MATPVLAASLGISPSHTELEVPGNGSATANFKVHYFSGDLQVSLVDIPLKVEPETIHIEPSSEPVDIQITIYGDESLGSQVYDGYVEFLGLTGGTVAVAIDVRVKVTNVVEGQVVAVSTDEPKEEEIIPTEQTPTTPQSGVPSYILIIGGLVFLGVLSLGIFLLRRKNA